MSANLFIHFKAQPAVTALLGANPFRLFPFGNAPRDCAKPYVIWQRIGGAPVQYLGNPPDCEENILQLDVYASDIATARQVAKVLITHLPTHASVSRYGMELREGDLWRSSFDLNWWEHY